MLCYGVGLRELCESGNRFVLLKCLTTCTYNQQQLKRVNFHATAHEHHSIFHYHIFYSEYYQKTEKKRAKLVDSQGERRRESLDTNQNSFY